MDPLHELLGLNEEIAWWLHRAWRVWPFDPYHHWVCIDRAEHLRQRRNQIPPSQCDGQCVSPISCEMIGSCSKRLFGCRVCGVICASSPSVGQAVCEEHCEDHDIEYDRDLRTHACRHCGKPVDQDWYDE